MRGRVIPLNVVKLQQLTQQRMTRAAKSLKNKDGSLDCSKLKELFEKIKVQDRNFRVSISYYESRKDPYITLLPTENAGEDLERISKGSSLYRQALKSLDPQKVWIRFYVWNDSFDVYLAARNYAAERGIAAGWQPRSGSQSYAVDIGFEPAIRDSLVCAGYKPRPPGKAKPKDPNAPQLPKDDVD